MQFSLKPLKLSYLVAITPSSGKSRKLCHLAFYQTSLHHRRLKASAAMAKNQNVFHHTKNTSMIMFLTRDVFFLIRVATAAAF